MLLFVATFSFDSFDSFDSTFLFSYSFYYFLLISNIKPIYIKRIFAGKNYFNVSK